VLNSVASALLLHIVVVNPRDVHSLFVFFSRLLGHIHFSVVWFVRRLSVCHIHPFCLNHSDAI